MQHKKDEVSLTKTYFSIVDLQLWLKDNFLDLHLVKECIALNGFLKWHNVFKHEAAISN